MLGGSVSVLGTLLIDLFWLWAVVACTLREMLHFGNNRASAAVQREKYQVVFDRICHVLMLTPSCKWC